jgi:hypothetical protein
MQLLAPHELPRGMVYPLAFERLVERQLTNFEPWWIFDASLARERMKGLAERYPGTLLVPFAKREDNDDVACFDARQPGKVVILHDFSSDGWERRVEFASFYDWLRRALEDMIEFDSMEDI